MCWWFTTVLAHTQEILPFTTDSEHMLNHQNGLQQLCFKVFLHMALRNSWKWTRSEKDSTTWLLDSRPMKTIILQRQKQWHCVVIRDQVMKPTTISGWNESKEITTERPRKQNEWFMLSSFQEVVFADRIVGSRFGVTLVKSHSLKRLATPHPPLGLTHLEMRREKLKLFHPPLPPPVLQRKHTEHIGKSEFPDVEVKLGWWDLSDLNLWTGKWKDGPFEDVFPIQKWWDVPEKCYSPGN